MCEVIGNKVKREWREWRETIHYFCITFYTILDNITLL